MSPFLLRAVMLRIVLGLQTERRIGLDADLEHAAKLVELVDIEAAPHDDGFSLAGPHTYDRCPCTGWQVPPRTK